ncbi:hypothetical protein HTZ84_05090 [Haloterrigena sp. SYSU A558-1]|uniref:Terminase small subunit n=1 Tax=Haloterrigena gelatinilytica TaxID=2741724 RepID=A0ABX2LBH4_9EURY|nr:hypothetical protein [Haloterrigena gelatinilytica]NUC71688.1 hypothetical protein [Haloterrigena gelatinilytica]
MSLQKQPDQQDQTKAERRKRSKEVYDALIRAVDYNTGRVQPPLAKQSSVIGTLHAAGHGSYGLEELHRAITAARRNGDLFRVEDNRGDVRLGIDDAETLIEKIETNRSYRESPRRNVIGLANQRIQYLRKQAEGDDDE